MFDSGVATLYGRRRGAGRSRGTGINRPRSSRREVRGAEAGQPEQALCQLARALLGPLSVSLRLYIKGLGEGAGEGEEARERDDEGGEVDEEDSERRSCHTAAGQYLADSELCAVTLFS